MNKIQAYITGQIISSNDSEAHSLHAKSYFGEVKQGKIQYTLTEALYLVEKGKLEVLQKSKPLLEKQIFDEARKIDKKIQIKYPVFKDLRDRGYILKTALKFGADFRIYDKGQKPGTSHAKWVCFVEHESSKLSWHEFSAKNRVAHSTKKNLLLAIVDEEGDISYYEVKWLKP
ncbi:tRNA-intron lyase [Candidatus Pacearchaeota archaeon]|nr:tRNA-intron lyase [Candidatus Pacearchaeota archaeon]